MSCKSKSCCETTVTQKGISQDISFTLNEDNMLVLRVGNRIYKVQLDDSISGGGGGGASPSITVPISSNGQALFINVIPEDHQLADVFLNGVLQDNEHYTTSGVGDRNLVWLDTVEQPLETDDTLKILVNTTTES